MHRGRVGEERGGKEMDRCPLTITKMRLNDVNGRMKRMILRRLGQC
jgi:hypothetical protein